MINKDNPKNNQKEVINKDNSDNSNEKVDTNKIINKNEKQTINNTVKNNDNSLDNSNINDNSIINDNSKNDDSASVINSPKNIPIINKNISFKTIADNSFYNKKEPYNPLYNNNVIPAGANNKLSQNSTKLMDLEDRIMGLELNYF